MHGKSHMYRCGNTVHMPDAETLIFEAENAVRAFQDAQNKKSMLTAWFQLNNVDPTANRLLYSEIPYWYTFQQKTKRWILRKKGHDKVVSRIYRIGPKAGDLFYLRMLLLHKRGAKSFIDFKTIDGVVCKDFKDACKALKLLVDDKQWIETLREAVQYQMPAALRQLFAIICTSNRPYSEIDLWNMFKKIYMKILGINWRLVVCRFRLIGRSSIEKYLSIIDRTISRFLINFSIISPIMKLIFYLIL